MFHLCLKMVIPVIAATIKYRSLGKLFTPLSSEFQAVFRQIIIHIHILPEY